MKYNVGDIVMSDQFSNLGLFLILKTIEPDGYKVLIKNVNSGKELYSQATYCDEDFTKKLTQIERILLGDLTITN